jgi:hypothetical protein
MTPLTPAKDAVRVALALALGREVERPARVDWPRARAAARAERLEVLAWARGGEQIRRYAPREVVGAWRAACVAVAELADRQLAALRAIAGVAVDEGEIPLVLKGLPLADRLYGDPSVRVCNDIDLFVPIARREAVHATLAGLGWHRWYGNAPFDASYRLATHESSLFLEVHSFLTGEALTHCPIAPDQERLWSHDGVTVRTLDEPVLPVYLAANLVKHGTPPLISYLDLAMVWQGLEASDREAALRLAAQSRLRRCLEWALSGAAAISDAAAGDSAAFRDLGFDGDRRTSMHAYMRLMGLVDRPADAARILGTWVWPRSLRRSPEAMVPFWGRRLRRSFAGRFKYARDYTPDAAPR